MNLRYKAPYARSRETPYPGPFLRRVRGFPWVTEEYHAVDFYQSTVSVFCNVRILEKTLQILLDAAMHKPKILQLSIAKALGKTFLPALTPRGCASGVMARPIP